MAGQYYVHIMSNLARTIYIGVTNNLERRVYEHKNKSLPGFAARYGLNQLVYYEVADSPVAAIEREEQLKGWLRSKKVALIETMNPQWKDLSAEWHESWTRTGGLRDRSERNGAK